MVFSKVVKNFFCSYVIATLEFGATDEMKLL